MREFFNVFTVLLLVGFVLPFVWQIVKLRIVKVAGNLAVLATLIVEVAAALIVLWCFGSLTVGSLVGAAIIMFVVSRTVYDHIVKQFFPRLTA